MQNPLILSPSGYGQTMIFSVMVIVLAIAAMVMLLLFAYILLRDWPGKQPPILYPIVGQYVGFSLYLIIRSIIAVDFLRHGAYRWVAVTEGRVSTILQLGAVGVMIACTAWLFGVFLDGRVTETKLGYFVASLSLIVIALVFLGIFSIAR